MKKLFLLLVIALCAFTGFNLNTRAAEAGATEVVAPIPIEPPGIFLFLNPVTDQVWYPDGVYGIKYTTTNLSGYLSFRLVSDRYGSQYLASFDVNGDGPDGEAFVLNHYTSSGDYRLEAYYYDYQSGRSWTWTSDAKITVPGVIVSPKADEVLRTGKKVRVKLSTTVPPEETYAVYLVGKGLGQYSRLALGNIKAGQNQVVVTIPNFMPNKTPILTGGGYSIVVRDFSYNFYGNAFSIFNPKLNLPLPSSGGGPVNNGSSGSSSGGGPVGIPVKN